MILVDSSVLIEFLKGLPTAAGSKFEAVLRQGLPFGINSFIFQEVLQGAASAKEFALLNEYLSTQRFYHLKDSVTSYVEAARIYMKCRKKGITIRSTIDCLIAQTVIEHDLFLLHNDNDFTVMAKVIPLKFF